MKINMKMKMSTQLNFLNHENHNEVHEIRLIETR